MKPLLSSALFLALGAAGVAFAQTPIQQTMSADADARIDISNVKGSITVSGWDEQKITVTGSLGKGAKGLAIGGDTRHLTVKVEPPDRGFFSWSSDTQMGDTTLEIKVPRGAALKIEAVSADVIVGGVDGASLNVESVSGKLRLDSGAKQLEIDSVSGNVDLTAKSDKAHVETVSGNIRARGLGGEVRLETVSGDIDADNAGYRLLDAGSVSGDLNLRGAPAADANIAVKTMSGDVHLRLPDSAPARLRAKTFSGDIRSDFGKVFEPDHGPGANLDATLGSGSAQVQIETFSGDIEIRKP